MGLMWLFVLNFLVMSCLWLFPFSLNSYWILSRIMNCEHCLIWNEPNNIHWIKTNITLYRSCKLNGFFFFFFSAMNTYSFNALYLAAKFRSWSEYVRAVANSGFIWPDVRLFARLVEKLDPVSKSFDWCCGGVPGCEDGVTLLDLNQNFYTLSIDFM